VGVVFGRYELLRELARGGMGSVHLARQTGLEGFEKLIVVKTLLPHLNEDREFVEMFLDEARIAAKLDHPNVCQIFDLGEIDGTYFLAMEFVRGVDLRTLLRDCEECQHLIPLPLTARIVSDAAAGLHYAHELRDPGSHLLSGLVHRDVSPQNVLVSWEGGVKLIDFGVAKAQGRATATVDGRLKGKYAYMSPEQASGEDIDRRSDVFALGIVFWEAVTGERLFRQETDVKTLRAVTDCEVAAPSTVKPGIPKSLDPVVMKALTRDPDDRYPTAQALRLAIEEWMRASGSPSSQAHVAEFMQDFYRDRIAWERTPSAIKAAELSISGGSKSKGPSGTKVKAGEGGDAGPQEPSQRSQSKAKSISEAAPQKKSMLPLVIGAAVGLAAVAVLFAIQPWKPAPAPPPEKSVVNVTLESVPPGATVALGDKVLGVTPTTWTTPPSDKPVTITFALKGYQKMTQSVTPADGAKLRPQLARVKKGPDPLGIKGAR
jgi:serine/threonine protein kinase